MLAVQYPGMEFTSTSGRRVQDPVKVVPYREEWAEASRTCAGGSPTRSAPRRSETALVLFYGAVGDDETTYRKDVVPLYDRPHLTITQTTRPSPLRPGSGRYRPPAGSVFVAAGARRGVLQSHGILVSIEAEDEQAILAAAHALEPMTD